MNYQEYLDLCRLSQEMRSASTFKCNVCDMRKNVEEKQYVYLDNDKGGKTYMVTATCSMCYSKKQEK